MTLHKKSIISFIIFFVAISFIIGYIYYSKIYNNYPSRLSQYTKTTNEKNTFAKEKLNPSRKVYFETLYKGNGEIVRAEKKADESLKLNNKDEISKIYKGWQIKEMSQSKIILYREIDGLPPDYYIISNNNGHITLFKSDGNGGKKLIQDTDITIESLNPNDRLRVQKSIIVKNVDEAYSILANFSS